ncbi:cyanophycinase [Roseateles saccharophilus]|uniref:Cyanophycinase n=1 Tax=Roseateles saccharophilus TaxID=304 RepID=A0A4R3VDK5_ROSSA|nr:cyanophycinase [Roseateles saccharophilus]MDG0835369.1 cyanophycinase [Roseateles saccharophilus]TCV02231.1 cyanophycinase [Roseateles saccharophilus]
MRAWIWAGCAALAMAMGVQAAPPTVAPASSAPQGFKLFRPATPASAARGTAPAKPTPAAPPPVAPAPASVDTEPAIRGYAVPIGGALKADNDEVWQRIVHLAGGKGARFVVFGTASEDPEASAKQAVDLLQRRGAIAEALPVAPKFLWVDLNKVVRDPALTAKVKAAKGVFFTGGAQERIVDVLQPGGQSTPMLEAIWDVYRKGGVVAGTSAGAAIMSAVMVRDGPSIIDILKGRFNDGKQVDRGLGFVGPNLFIDQHFLKRGRFGRMIPLMMAKGYKIGLGVDENTAAIIRGDEIEIIGDRGALVVDLTEARTDPSLGAFNVQGARLSYLEHGDRYHVRARATTPSAPKLRGELHDAESPSFKPYYTDDVFHLDMLGDSTISNAMSRLIDSSRKEVKGLAFDVLPRANDPLAELGFLFRLYKSSDSLGWSTEEFGGEQFTVANLYLDISPVRLPMPLYGSWAAPRQPAASASEPAASAGGTGASAPP